MNRLSLLLIFFLGFLPLTNAQKHLEGRWEGNLIENGKSYILRLNIERVGNELSAEIHCITNDTTFTRTVSKGRLFTDDRSLYLIDFDFVYPDDPSSNPVHIKRKYQLVYERDFNTITLNGYWQEKENINKNDRRLGQIRLKKMVEKKRA